MAARAQQRLPPGAQPCAPSQSVATPMARLVHPFAQHRRHDSWESPRAEAEGATSPAAPPRPHPALDCAESMAEERELTASAAALPVALPPLPPLRAPAASLRSSLGEPPSQPGLYTFGCPIGGLLGGSAAAGAAASAVGTPRCR